MEWEWPIPNANFKGKHKAFVLKQAAKNGSPSAAGGCGRQWNDILWQKCRWKAAEGKWNEMKKWEIWQQSQCEGAGEGGKIQKKKINEYNSKRKMCIVRLETGRRRKNMGQMYKCHIQFISLFPAL